MRIGKSPLPFIGRSQKSGHLREFVAGGSRGAAMVVRGPTGSGKTRLVDHVLAGLELPRDTTVVRTGRDTTGAQRAWWPVQSILRASMGVGARPSFDQFASSATTYGLPARDAPGLAELLGIAGPLASAGLAVRKREAIASARRALAVPRRGMRATVLWFDDVGDYDASSRRLLQAVADTANPAQIRLLVTTTAGDSPIEDATVLELAALSRSEVGELVDSLDVSEPDPDVWYETSGGLPAAVDLLAGVASYRDWPAEPPTSAARLVDAVVTALPAGPQRAVMVAAVAGGGAPVATAVSIAGDAAAFELGLAEAADRRLVEVVDDAISIRWRAVGDAVLARAPLEQLHKVRARALDALDSSPSPHAPGAVGIRAAAAGAHGRAAEEFVAAGDDAIGHFDTPGGARWYRRAIAALDAVASPGGPGPLRIAASVRLAGALCSLGELDQATAVVERTALGELSAAERATIDVMRGHIAVAADQVDAGVARYRDAVAAATADGGRRVGCDAYIALALALRRSPDPAAAAAEIAAGTDLLAGGAGRDWISEVPRLWLLGFHLAELHLRAGQLQAAVQVALAALAQTEAREAHHARGQVLSLLSRAADAAGNGRQAIKYRRSALEALRRAGDRRGTAELLVAIAYASAESSWAHDDSTALTAQADAIREARALESEIDSSFDARVEASVGRFHSMASTRIASLSSAWMMRAERDDKAPAGFWSELGELKQAASVAGFAGLVEVVQTLEELVAHSTRGEAAELVAEGLDTFVAVLDVPARRRDDAVRSFVTRAKRITAPRAAPGAPSTGAQAQRIALPQNNERVGHDKLAHLEQLCSELLLRCSKLTAASARLGGARASVAGVAGTGSLSEAALRMLDAPMAAVREVELEIATHGQQIGVLVAELEGASRELRMVPIRDLFDIAPRAARARARELGLEVKLERDGDAALADRAVLDELEPVLLHLVRNALDHGIEQPEARRLAGKPVCGTVTLSAAIDGAHLHIDVADDGAGIAVERVRAAAVATGKLTTADAAGRTDQQILACLFDPDESTRPEATQSFGHGIGLDAVLARAKLLGGTATIASLVGVGTRVRITVPMGISISPILVFDVGSDAYAVPAARVEGVFDAALYDVVDPQDAPTIRHAGQDIAVVDMASAVDAPEVETAMGDRPSALLVVQSLGARTAFRSTSNHVRRDAIVRSAHTAARKPDWLEGLATLDDDRVVRIVDVDVLHAAAFDARPSEPPAKTALVVDESEIVRDIVGASLRSHGFSVLEAEHGQEALDTLATTANVSIVITDAEMPVVDGLELIRIMRRQTATRDIPAIMVSMRASDAERQEALDAGASAFVLKSEFSTGALWETVSRFVR